MCVQIPRRINKAFRVYVIAGNGNKICGKKENYDGDERSVH